MCLSRSRTRDRRALSRVDPVSNDRASKHPRSIVESFVLNPPAAYLSSRLRECVKSLLKVTSAPRAQCPRFRARALGCRRTPFFFPLHGLIDENTLLHHGLIDENTRSGRLIGTLHVSIDQSINRVRTPFHSMHFNSIPFHSMRLPRRKNSKGEIIDHGKGVNLENVDRVKMLIGGTCLCLCPE